MLPRLLTSFGVGALSLLNPDSPMKILRVPPRPGSLSQIFCPRALTLRPLRSPVNPAPKAVPGNLSVSYDGLMSLITVSKGLAQRGLEVYGSSQVATGRPPPGSEPSSPAPNSELNNGVGACLPAK